MSIRNSCKKRNATGYMNSAYVEEKNLEALGDRRQNNVQEIKRNNLKPLSFIALFQYSTHCERFYILFALLLAIFSGLIPPVINILYGEFSNMMVDRQFPTDAPSTNTIILPWFGGGRVLQNASVEERYKAMQEDSVAWGIGCGFLSFVQFMASSLSVFLLCWTAAKQVSRIKILFFKAMVCKDMAWFDTRMDGNFAGTFSDNMNQLEAGIGGVIGIVSYLMTIFVFGVVIALAYGWKLALAILSTVPISIGTSFVVAKIERNLAAKEMAAYIKAGEVAEEVFSSIRTVNAFEGEEKEVHRYSKILQASRNCGIKRGIATGISNGLLWLVIYISYSVAFSYGIRLIHNSKENGDDEYTPSGLLVIFFGVLTGLTNLGFASNHLETFSVACAAAASVFDVINTKSVINPCLEEGKLVEDCRGEIEFRNVYFEYPSRPSISILKGLNLKIKAGETVAIVGGSGVGKSTILQLVQRLYDPSQGDVFLDGQNIKSIRVSWLRKQLGVVGQEPLLFATTIQENISYGLPTATEEDIIKAAEQANAHDFIMKLVENYDTVVGQKGSTLSGGQKQRIAIARALVRNPKILLLDEATSALDTTSQKIVQAALDKAAKGRTTLIVTHRLSTIANADRIIVLANGVIAEEGTHRALVDAKGLYYGLLQTQGDNVKGTKKPEPENLPNTVVYEEPTLPPLGPRHRYSILSSYSTTKQGGPDSSAEQLREAARITLLQIVRWSKPEWVWLTVGCLGSLIAGAALPAVCVLFASLFGLFSVEDYSLVLRETDLYAVILVGVGVIAGVCVFFQMYCLAVVKMRMTTRLRIKAFDSMVHQDIGWFDEEKNRVGALCLKLSQDVSGLQGAVGNSLGIILQAISTMTISTTLSFFIDWKITLVTLATIPFVFSGVYIESICAKGPNTMENTSEENASKIAVEVISNIRAVASLGKEKFFLEKYTQTITEGKKNNLKNSFLRAFAFGIGQTAPFFGYAVSLWYGGTLIVNENLHYRYVIMVSELLIFGAWTLGQSVFFASGFGEAKSAARRLQYLFLRKPVITDGDLTSSPKLSKGGSIKYSKVHFAYPTRPAVDVLRNFSMTIKAGESVAIVGPSGSGKSTVIQLLQRFYNPNSGTITINNDNIANYKLSSLKKIFGLVSQEPVLFDRTIQENIAYGDNSRVISLNEIIAAAEKANIHSFIASLPLGYDTKLGAGAAQLSGGQKQRIAIARALVRNPQILLLDEATSALDPGSESIVQEALDKAVSGRTTITIAHRLGAVRHADVIYVLEKGVIVESGTHGELMDRRGIYYAMHNDDDHKNRANTSKK